MIIFSLFTGIKGWKNNENQGNFQLIAFL